MYILIAGAHAAATSSCVVSWHSLVTTVLSCSWVENLYGLFSVFKIIESLSPSEVLSVIRFLSQSYSEQRTRHCDIENFATLWQCKTSHCSSDQSFIGFFSMRIFGALLPRAPNLWWAISIFSAVWNIILGTITTKKTKTGKRPWLPDYRSRRKVTMKWVLLPFHNIF